MKAKEVQKRNKISRYKEVKKYTIKIVKEMMKDKKK